MKKLLKYLTVSFWLASFNGDATSDISEPITDRSTVIIGQYVYKPFYSESGKGIALEILTAAFNAVNIDVDIRITPLMRTKKDLITGRIDLFGGGGTTNFSAEEKSKYSIEQRPYFNYALTLAYYKENLSEIELLKLKQFKQLSDLQGLTFGSLNVYPGNEELSAAGLKHIEYLPSYLDINYEQLHMLRKGLFDTTQITVLSALTSINYGFSIDKDSFRLTSPFYFSQAMRFYDANNLRGVYFNDKCEEGMALIKQGGANSIYYKILESYWGMNNVPKYALPDELKPFGVDELNVQQALSYQRDKNFKIVK